MLMSFTVLTMMACLLSPVALVVCFSPVSFPVRNAKSSDTHDMLHVLSAVSKEWTPLADESLNVFAVKIRRIAPESIVGTSEPPSGAVEIAYKGTLAELDWSAFDVVECWLSEQQGLEHLAPVFLEKDVNGDRLKCSRLCS